ncbi:MAG TPA: parallel beta-helix domain-containing protein, partial [Pseudomonadales bacterium]|nr:parallel beta-helix domain-containing protein [Pseudomonadales bacterium]
MKITRKLGWLAVCCLAAYGTVAQATTYIKLAAGPDLQYRLQTQLITAQPDTIIELPEGKFEFTDELISRQKFITLRGQGMYTTVLNFKNQSSGAQGLLATGDGFTLQDVGIEDAAGDGFKAEGVNGLTIRGVRVEWTRGPSRYNGSYGLYPVRSSNILMEDNIVKGSSDAGLYVGQSSHVIVR